MTPRSLSRAIAAAKSSGRIGVIGDIKPISPRDGDLLGMRRADEIARSLIAAGACALSVVTEPKHFGGSLQILREVTAVSTVPVLQKDFFLTREQVTAAYEAGADAFLLILAMTPGKLASELYQHGHGLGMEAVVEVHSRSELLRALELQPAIIGINNRNILELEKDDGHVGVTEALAPLVPERILTISESSLRSKSDVLRAVRSGADAVLIGTAVLQAGDAHDFLRNLTVLSLHE